MKVIVTLVELLVGMMLKFVGAMEKAPGELITNPLMVRFVEPELERVMVLATFVPTLVIPKSMVPLLGRLVPPGTGYRMSSSGVWKHSMEKE